MNIEIIDVEQGSPEWFSARAGVPTCSRFGHVMARGRGAEDSKVRAAYLYQLADEVIYNDPVDGGFTNEHTERGKLLEAEARSIYALENDVIPQCVGFIKNHTVGAGGSPDALIGKNGILEIKTMLPRLWIRHVLTGGHPPEFTAQIQGLLWVSGDREWCDLMIYWPRRQPYITRVYRDEPYIAQLAQAVKTFNKELATIVAAIRTKFDLRATLEEAAAEAAQ
jgi:hypothetical protein